MLTERELEILARRAKGERQRAIAAALGISQAAVSKFETNARRKILAAAETLERAAALNLAVEETAAGKRVRRSP